MGNLYDANFLGIMCAVRHYLFVENGKTEIYFAP